LNVSPSEEKFINKKGDHCIVYDLTLGEADRLSRQAFDPGPEGQVRTLNALISAFAYYPQGLKWHPIVCSPAVGMAAIQELGRQ
jgi:hypothetical protein